MWVSFDKSNKINVISDTQIQVDGQVTKYIKMQAKQLIKENFVPKPASELKIALICNWNTKCGISTYSKFLAEAITPQVKEIRIFSECSDFINEPDGPNIERCWNRGEPLLSLARKVKSWNPDFIIIQHEYGLFPNAFYFMQLMQAFSNIPYVVTMHSVYKHLDKIVYSSCVKDIAVHTQQGKDVLLSHGHSGNITVISHGCVAFKETAELWNIFQNPYTIIQFGFGFAYKGVETAFKAIKHLKETDQKFQNIFYLYLLSENEHTARIHNQYYDSLTKLSEELGIENNIAITRKYQSDYIINLYLRLAKLAIFPYTHDPQNIVYASSGAIRVAMANGIPVIASSSHLFDDLEGVVPRVSGYLELAHEIDKIFSDNDYRHSLIKANLGFVQSHPWSLIAQQYLQIYQTQSIASV